MSITLEIVIMVVNLFFSIVGIGCFVALIKKKNEFMKPLFWAFVSAANASNLFITLDQVSKKLF